MAVVHFFTAFGTVRRDLEEDDLVDDEDDDFPVRLIISTLAFLGSRSFAGDHNSWCCVLDFRVVLDGQQIAHNRPALSFRKFQSSQLFASSQRQ
jgi:hypothetical protein